MPDIPTPEQVEAIRERHKRTSNPALPGLGVWCSSVEHHMATGHPWPCETIRLLADHDALTAEVERLRLVEHDHGTLQAAYASLGEMHSLAHDRAEAAERKVAAVRAEVGRWEADEQEHLATFGQHHPASLGRVAEIIRAVLDGEDA